MARYSTQEKNSFDRRILRIIDANINRSLEGLRVIEEFARFFLQDRNLTAKIKKNRHALVKTIRRFNLEKKSLISARDAVKDPGKKSIKSEMQRKGLKHIIVANLQRVKESLRVLEEYLKLSAETEDFKKIRFEIYDIEKRIIKKF